MQVEPMNKQAVFEKVVTHLYNQKSQARNSKQGCAYRGTRGKTCAVGCLIKDEYYDKAQEGFSVNSDIVLSAVAKSLEVGMKPSDVDLLGSLQGLHDDRLPRQKGKFRKTAFLGRVEGLAYDFHLDTSFLEALRARP